jgi:hypothetical protein
MPHYTGHLMEKGPPERSLAIYSFVFPEGRPEAISRLVAYAENTMKSKGISSANLVMIEGDVVIGTRTMEGGKHPPKP